VQEGVNVTTARKLLTAASKLQRLAELACSSEAADRDRVKCPKAFRQEDVAGVGTCLCRDYGSYDPDATTPGGDPDHHGAIPRIGLTEARTEKRVTDLCAKHGLSPEFGGDPRGAVLKLKVPSGKTNDWSGTGIAVPSRGYSAAQMERISR